MGYSVVGARAEGEMDTHRIENWQTFVASAAQWTKGGPNGANIFRGQAEEDWALCPSLTRLLNERGLALDQAVATERRILEEFQNRYHGRDDHCAQLRKSDLLSWWEMMQHYSVPTRLLDWATSPYAALYFSVSTSMDRDGALFIMDAGHLQWIQVTRARDPEDTPNLKAFQELNKSVNGEPFEKSMVIISSPTPTTRMLAQHSSFTISTELLESHDVTGDDITFGRCVNRAETNPSLFDKFVVPKELKSEFTERLGREGFTQDILFPDSRLMDREGEAFLERIRNIFEECA